MNEMSKLRHILEINETPRLAIVPAGPPDPDPPTLPPSRPWLKKRAKGRSGWFDIIQPRTRREQIFLWRDGISLHYQDKCVPDFSCCVPELRASKAVREKYLRSCVIADEDTKTTIDLIFYSAVARFLVPEKKVEIEGFFKC